jgi:hypothetical protein
VLQSLADHPGGEAGALRQLADAEQPRALGGVLAQEGKAQLLGKCRDRRLVAKGGRREPEAFCELRIISNDRIFPSSALLVKSAV